jgi:outer membrane protein
MMAMSYSMRLRLVRLAAALLAVCVLLLAHAAASAQQAARPTLSLEEAIDLALGRNPEHRIQERMQAAADWAVREAYGAVLPSVHVSSSMQYQAAGTPTFGLFTSEDIGFARTPPYYFSNYALRLGLNLSGATFFRMAEQRASRSATQARVTAAEHALAASVTRQYLAALRARDAVRLAEQELATAADARRLATARFAAGDATRLDVAQAEVDYGRAEVSLVQARHARETSLLALMQQLGTELVADVELTSVFEVFAPAWSVTELVAEALRAHPQLAAARAAEDAGRASARSARMAYLPSLSASGVWSGYTRQAGDDAFLLDQARGQSQGRIDNCEFVNAISAGLNEPLTGYPVDCSRYVLTPEQEQQILARNSVFPFSYTTQPASFTLTVSLPIVDGFTRERTMQTARIAADDARDRRRAEELALRTRVTAALLGLEAAHATVAIEARSAAAAGEQLELARERYRLGAGSILELTQAQTQKAGADQRHLAAVYAFHESLADLEAAVGRRLR